MRACVRACFFLFFFCNQGSKLRRPSRPDWYIDTSTHAYYGGPYQIGQTVHTKRTYQVFFVVFVNKVWFYLLPGTWYCIWSPVIVPPTRAICDRQTASNSSDRYGPPITTNPAACKNQTPATNNRHRYDVPGITLVPVGTAVV